MDTVSKNCTKITTTVVFGCEVRGILSQVMVRLQFDDKINPLPETSRLALTGSLVVLCQETMQGTR